MSYRVPFVNYPKHYQGMKNEILKMFNDVLFARADLILRDDVRQFENNIASFIGVKYAVGVNSCTDAMRLSLCASGIKQGDEVITVAHTFVATVEAIIHSGGKPTLVDIGDDFNMNVDLLEDAITSNTKAIIPVHLNGRVCNMGKIMEIASRYNLIIIEDAAQALGATFNGKAAGSFGLAGCFSFFPAKLLGAAGDAGIVVTNDRALCEKIRLLRDHGRKTKEEIVCYGFNSRIDNIQAAILNLKFKYISQWIERRREIAGMYLEGLKGISGIQLPPEPKEQDKHFDVFQNYVVRARDRDKLVEYLDRCGIETLISWRKPMHKHKALNLSHFKLPITEKASKEVVSLPMNTEVTNEQVGYVIKHIRMFYDRS